MTAKAGEATSADNDGSTGVELVKATEVHKLSQILLAVFLLLGEAIFSASLATLLAWIVLRTLPAECSLREPKNHKTDTKSSKNGYSLSPSEEEPEGTLAPPKTGVLRYELLLQYKN